MAVFLAGVGNAELFKVVDNQEQLWASAKTLTESSITIGVSEEDIRAGMGAKLYGKYFHTSTFDLKLTDAMFRLEYLAASVGSELEFGGEVFKDEQLTTVGKVLTLSTAAVPMLTNTGDNVDKIYAYVRKPSEDTYRTYEVVDNQVTVPEDGTYCVKYLYTNDNARTLTVKANFIPDTLRLYLTCNLYSGDDKNPSTGTRIGSITVMVPRFMLKGNQDLSMSMTGAATTSLEGSALAADAEGCDGEGIYAKIIEVIDGTNWKDQVIAIAVDNGTETVAAGVEFEDTLVVYALFNGMLPKQVKVSDYTASTVDGLTVEGGKVSGTLEDGVEATITIALKDTDKTITKTYIGETAE